MTDAEITSTMKSVLSGIAPEVDLDDVDPEADLREELELDSIDVLHFLVGLNEELGVDIPESAYGTLTTKAAIVDYVKQRAPQPTGPEEGDATPD